MNSFDATFFMSGTEGGILLALGIVAIVCTLAVIALAVIVVLTIRRRKREDEVLSVQKEQASAEQEAQAEIALTEQSEQAEIGQASAEVLAEQPAEIPAKISEQTKVTATIFAGSGVRYNRSFKAKLIQSGDEVKKWYAALKNALLSYKKVKSRISWKRESFRLGRKIVARFGYRGNTLCIYLPLDPAAYADSKYKVEDVSGYSAYADTHCMYRLKNERRARYAAELISEIMSAWEVERIERAAEDHYLPFEETEALVEKGLIKVVKAAPPAQDGEEVAATEIPEEQPEEVPEEEFIDEVVPAEVSEEQPANEVAIEEVTEVEVDDTEILKEQSEAISEEEPAEEFEETNSENAAVERSIDAVEKAAEEEPKVEELTARELNDLQSYENKANDEDGVEVVGVMFRRRGRKVYWFDPDGKKWEKGEIALYKSPDNPPQEVIVVDNAKISPSKLHLPLKPLHKTTQRPQSNSRKLK